MRFSGSKRVDIARLALAAIAMLSTGAVKPEPPVTGSWRGAPSSMALCAPFNLVLHLEAKADVADVSAEVLQSAGVEVVSGTKSWLGGLLAGQALDLPVRARVVADGKWTLGARLSARRSAQPEVSGAVLYVMAANGQASLSATPFEAGNASTRSGDARPETGTEPDRGRSPLRASPPAPGRAQSRSSSNRTPCARTP